MKGSTGKQPDPNRRNKPPKAPAGTGSLRHFFGGPLASVDQSWAICDMAVSLADRILNCLPLITATPAAHPRETALRDHWDAQTAADLIESWLNPMEFPFGSADRLNHFRLGTTETLWPAAGQFLKAFDNVRRHYGWHTEPPFGDVWSNWERWFGPFEDLPPDARLPEPWPAIAQTLPRALKKAANKLWSEIVQDLPRWLNHREFDELAQALVPLSARERVCAIRHKYPGSTEQEIADKAGVNRTSVYRMARLMELEAEQEAEAKENVQKGTVLRNPETGSQHVDGIVPAADYDDETEGASED
jgi:hypothetical protein